MNDSDFLWLLNWFNLHCNGDWEHGSGIRLESMDNPGWSITIDLELTELEDKEFRKIDIERSDDDWVYCYIEYCKFEGRCGSQNLIEILKIFRDWASQ